MIPSTRPADMPQPSLARDLLYLARYYLGGRRGLLVIAGLALVAGLTLNWGWLMAAGIAPVLISLLPCAAMCALGLCMSRSGGTSCSTDASVRDTAATDDAASGGRGVTLDASPGLPVQQIPSGAEAALADTQPHPLKQRNTNDA